MAQSGEIGFPQYATNSVRQQIVSESVPGIPLHPFYTP